MANETQKDKYPSGSTLNPEKVKPTEAPEIEAIATGRKKKPSFFKRAFSDFVGEDVDNVGRYIWTDVIIPATKNLIVDAFEGGLEMLLFGSARRSKRGKGSIGGIFNYNGISTGKTEHSGPSLRARARHDFDDIEFDNKSEAEDVLHDMVDYLETYGLVSVAVFYQLAGVSPAVQDHNWGWKSLKNATVTRTRDRTYVIELPKPDPIR